MLFLISNIIFQNKTFSVVTILGNIGAFESIQRSLSVKLKVSVKEVTAAMTANVSASFIRKADSRTKESMKVLQGMPAFLYAQPCTARYQDGSNISAG